MSNFPNWVELKSSDVKAVYSTKEHPLGTRGITDDGRVFAFALAGEALNKGIPINPLARGGLATAGSTELNNDTQDLTSTSRQIILSTTNSTWGALADEYADGYLVVEASTHSKAAGSVVRVKSNTAGSTSTTDSPYQTTVVFADDDKLENGMDTGCAIQVVHNEYFDVIEHDGGATVLPIVGVTINEVANNEYFWAQTWGPCAVLTDGALVYGNVVVGSTQADQGVQAVALLSSTGSSDTALASTIPLFSGVRRMGIGWVLGPNSGDNDYTLVFLTIRP